MGNVVASTFADGFQNEVLSFSSYVCLDFPILEYPWLDLQEENFSFQLNQFYHRCDNNLKVAERTHRSRSCTDTNFQTFPLRAC